MPGPNPAEEDWAERQSKREAEVARVLQRFAEGERPKPGGKPRRACGKNQGRLNRDTPLPAEWFSSLWPRDENGRVRPLEPGLVGGAGRLPPGLPRPPLPRPPDHTDRGLSNRTWERLMMEWRDSLRAY